MEPDEPVRRSESAPCEIDKRCFTSRLLFHIKPDPPTAEPALETHYVSGSGRGAGDRREVIVLRKDQLSPKFTAKK